MAAFIPNFAKGKIARYAELPLANDALVWVLFSGVETDAALRDLDNLSQVLATPLDEATFTGYSRQTATGITVTVDDTNDRVDVDSADPIWLPTSSQALKRIGLFYDPDTGSGTDADLVFLFMDDYDLTTPTTGSIGYIVAASGFARAS